MVDGMMLAGTEEGISPGENHVSAHSSTNRGSGTANYQRRILFAEQFTAGSCAQILVSVMTLLL